MSKPFKLLAQDDVRVIFNHISRAGGGCAYCTCDILAAIIKDYPDLEKFADEVVDNNKWKKVDWKKYYEKYN